MGEHVTRPLLKTYGAPWWKSNCGDLPKRNKQQPPDILSLL
jgi:hypothetical protein